MESSSCIYHPTKLGGSVAYYLKENATQLKEQQDSGKRPVVITSGPRTESSNSFGKFNLTTDLNNFAADLQIGDQERAQERAQEKLAAIEHFLRQNPHISAEKRAQANQIIEKHLSGLKTLTEDTRAQIHTFGSNWVAETGNETNPFLEITAIGEALGRDLLANEIGEQAAAVELTPANNLSDFEKKFNPNIFPHIITDIRQKISPILAAGKIPILGGYHAGIAKVRGYSDVMSVLVTAALQEMGKKTNLIIDKDFAIYSADPREVDAEVIPWLSYGAALEFFGQTFGGDAKAVTGPALRTAATRNVPITVTGKNGKRSIISQKKPSNIEEKPGLLGLSTRPKIHLQLQSNWLSGQGIAGKIGQIFDKHGVAFDESAHAEGTMSYVFSAENKDTLSSESFQRDLKNTLSEFGAPIDNLEVKPINMFYFVGNDLSQPGIAAKVAKVFKEEGINISFQSNPNSKHSLVHGIFGNPSQAQPVLTALHKSLIEKTTEPVEAFAMV